MPLDFSEDEITWVASKLSGTAGTLGTEAIELRNFPFHFRCVLEEFKVIVADMNHWMDNSSPSWAAYCALMLCRLVALNKCPGVRPVGMYETLCQAIAKLIIREMGDQAKTACGSLQLYVSLESGIEGATHAVLHRRRERNVLVP